MRTAIGFAQYFALSSWLLSLLVSLEQCWSTPPQLVSCEVVSCGRVVDTTTVTDKRTLLLTKSATFQDGGVLHEISVDSRARGI